MSYAKGSESANSDKAKSAFLYRDPAAIYEYCVERFRAQSSDDCFSGSSGHALAELYGNALFDIWLTRRASFEERLDQLRTKAGTSIWSLAAEAEDAAFRKTASLDPLLGKMRALGLSSRMRKFVDSMQISADMQAGRWSSVKRILARQSEVDVLRGELFAWARTQLLLRSKDIASAQRFVAKMRYERPESPFATLLAARVAIAIGRGDDARVLYAGSSDPSVMLENGLMLIRTGDIADEKSGTSAIDNALIAMRLRADVALATALYLIRHKQSALAGLLLWRLEGHAGWSEAKDLFTDYHTIAAWMAVLEGQYTKAKASLQRSLTAMPMDFEGNWLRYLICRKEEDMECQVDSLRNLFTVAGADAEVQSAIDNAAQRYPEHEALQALKREIEK